MWNVIDQCYGKNIGYDGPVSIFDIFTRVFQMEKHLMEWQRTLPNNIRLIKSQHIPFVNENNGHLLERFSVVLTLRYHNLRILLHRPILTKFLELSGQTVYDDQEFELLQGSGCNSVEICVQSSMEIIAIVNQVVVSPRMRESILGAWWFTLYYSGRNLL